MAPKVSENSSSKASKIKFKIFSFLKNEFSYSTIKEVKVYNVFISVIYKILTYATIGYIAGWELYHNKSYQLFDPVESMITCKIKGVGFIHDANLTTESIPDYRFFDPADYVIPPSEYNSIFIKTNFIETKQTQGKCLATSSKPAFRCNTDNDCQNKNLPINLWNGIPTGKCISTHYNNQTVKVCEIRAWCPLELDINDGSNVISNVYEYTLFIKNDIHFRIYDKRNQKGGVIGIDINWDCNLDFDFSKCLPEYTFERYDLRFSTESAASGLNFRYADKFEINGSVYRNLIKAYGLRFIIKASGQAGKFDFVQLFLTIGVGLGLLAIPPIIADVILLHCTPRRKFYRKLKVQREDQNLSARV